MPVDWEHEEARLAARALADGDSTGWFDELYAAAAQGRVTMPWGRTEPHPLVHEWAERRRLRGDGRRAVVVGCGLGADAEHVALLGSATVAFDISPTAIRLARQRHPGRACDTSPPISSTSPLPGGEPSTWWWIITVQALPDPPRRQAIVNVGQLVCPGEALLVIAAAQRPQRPAPGRADLYLSSSMHRGGRASVSGMDWAGHRTTGSYSDNELLVTTLAIAVA